MVFDCSDGELVYSRRTENICLLCGFSSTGSSKHYRFYTVSESTCLSNEMAFDLSAMRYTVTTSAMSGGSIHRKPIDACTVGDILFVSSTTGDLAVYDLASKSFKGCLKLDGDPISLLRTVSKTTVAASSGGNTVILLDASDWRAPKVMRRILITKNGEAIISLHSNRKGDIYVSTSGGESFKIDCRDWQVNRLPLQLCPSRPVCSALTPQGLITGCESGQVFLWDMESYTISKCFSPVRKSIISSVFITNDLHVYCGFSDGSVAIYAEQYREIAQAHRGAVSGIFAVEDFFASTGVDGIVRVWKGSRCVTEFSATEIGGIAIVAEDVFVYTARREIIEFSLKKNKMIKKLSALNLGGIVGMVSSLLDGRDTVLVTAHHEGRSVVWDFDYDHPLKIFFIEEKLTCICRSGENQVLVGTQNGGMARIDVDSDPSVPVPVLSNEISSKPIISITSLDNRTVLINTEGTVMIV